MANKALVQAILTGDSERIKNALADVPEFKQLIFLRQKAAGDLVDRNGKTYTVEQIEAMLSDPLKLFFVPAAALTDEQIEKCMQTENDNQTH